MGHRVVKHIVVLLIKPITSSVLKVSTYISIITRIKVLSEQGIVRR